MSAEIRAGDYFYTSWGYDQTNIDYLVVVQLSPSRKTALCRMAKGIYIGSQGVEDVLMPGEAYGEPFRMQVYTNDNGMRLRGSYPYCNGAKRLDSFYPIALGETRNQTMAQFGH